MNTKISILIIEDEKNICDFIATALISQGYRAFKSYSGTDGISQITSRCPDLLLLDLGLPDMDGMNIIEEVRKWSSMPIIVISARTQENEKVLALDAGADDYITKPFGTSELLARVRTAVRHLSAANGQGAQSHILDTPRLAVFPGLLILITVLSFNLLGDVLRTALEPKIVE